MATALVVSACGGASGPAALSEPDLTYATAVCDPLDDVLDRLLAAQAVDTTEVRQVFDALPDTQTSVVEEIFFLGVIDITEAVQVADAVDAKSTEQCGYPLVRVLLHTTLDCRGGLGFDGCTDSRLSLAGVPTVQAQLEALA